MDKESYLKEWFPTEKEANDFAKKVKGNVYDADFLGGYEVMYPKEMDKIAQQILSEYQTKTPAMTM